MKKNLGTFNGDFYIKHVSFSKAVLWKDRQISLPPEVVKQFIPKNTKTVVFEDLKKGERWFADVDKLRENYQKKKVGQEEQYYFPIEVFTKEPLSTLKD